MAAASPPRHLSPPRQVAPAGDRPGRASMRDAPVAERQQPRLLPPNKNRFDDGLAEREGTRDRTRPTGIFRAKTASIMEAVQIQLLSVDTSWSPIMVHVSIVIALVDD